MKETIILINEENHGMLMAAKTYRDAVLYLYDNRWLTDYTEMFASNDPNETELKRISEWLGEDWIDDVAEKWNINDFNEYFEGLFYLQEIEVANYESPT